MTPMSMLLLLHADRSPSGIHQLKCLSVALSGLADAVNEATERPLAWSVMLRKWHSRSLESFRDAEWA